MPQRTFSDLNWDLEIHPATNDVLRVYDANAIKASVKHLVLTEFYGRPFHPEIGSSVAGLLFEPWSPIVDRAVEISIEDIINNHEPRATVNLVSVEFDDKTHTYKVTVHFYMNALMQEATVDLLLERAR